MRTFDEWLTILSKCLSELKQLEELGAATQWRRSMKEQELGQYCCEAGEDLDDQEVSRLKKVLGLAEKEWQAYKSKARPEQE